jgi:hypothetical protein
VVKVPLERLTVPAAFVPASKVRGDHDVRAFGGETLSDRGADATTGSGDQCCTAGETPLAPIGRTGPPDVDKK